MRATVLLSWLVALLVALPGATDRADAAGPWRAVIVDAETGKPVDGVVVLAYWMKYTGGPGGWGAAYYAADETVTGVDGHFEIPARITFTWVPFFTQIRGPEFKIFKPGYGRWDIRAPEQPAGRQRKPPSDLLAQDGAVIALPPLKTREERLTFTINSSPWPPSDVPFADAPRLYEALRRERAYLGLDGR
jgi:hypothetical protein